MGQRGPAQKPAQVLKLTGQFRKDRHSDDVKPDNRRPRMPRTMSEESKRVWRYLVPRLLKLGVLTEIDGNALERYCRLWGEWRKLQAIIDEKGHVYSRKDRNGEVVAIRTLPQVKVRDEISKDLLSLERQFGLTPSARTSIRLERDEKNDDPLADLMAG